MRNKLLLLLGLVLAPIEHAPTAALANVSIGGFVPFMGIGLTDEFQTFDQDVFYNNADFEASYGGSLLGGATGPYFDLALVDTGAATHIITEQAYNSFNIASNGFSGTNFQAIGGATGIINMQINDPLGYYATGLANRTSSGATLGLNASTFRGQSSTAILSAPTQWTLPNILGLPIAAQHQIVIRNDQPQVFELHGRTVRTPEVELQDLGTGGVGAGPGGADIIRRAALNLNPGSSFVQGPFYLPNIIIDPDLEFNFHDNPLSPTVVANAGLFIDTDLDDGPGGSVTDAQFLFDTGADMTVVSEQTALSLGFDAVLDTPDFILQVEGSGGVTDGIPGFYVDQLNLDTVGGSFTMNNVPLAVLDVTNPSDPGNIVPGILGMHLFNGRNLAIDANPSVGQGGVGPSVYISDPVTTMVAWANQSASGDWSIGAEWQGGAVPGELSDVFVGAVGADSTANVTTDEQIYRTTIAGDGAAEMTVRIAATGKLTTYGETRIDDGGVLFVDGGELDAQYINLESGGVLKGEGDVFIGAGPLSSPLRNAGGRIEVGADTIDAILTGKLNLDGDLSNGDQGVVAFELSGTAPGFGHDQLAVERFAFISGELEVALIPGYEPNIGDTYTLLTAGEGITGMFDTHTLPSGYLWDVTYNPTSLVIEVTALNLLPGDANGDGMVDLLDLDALGANYGMTSGATLAQGDFNGDGAVNLLDLDILGANYGATASGATAVPEPSSIALLLLAGVMLNTARKRS